MPWVEGLSTSTNVPSIRLVKAWPGRITSFRRWCWTSSEAILSRSGEENKGGRNDRENLTANNAQRAGHSHRAAHAGGDGPRPEPGRWGDSQQAASADRVHLPAQWHPHAGLDAEDHG